MRESKELADYVLAEGQSQDDYAVERRLFRDGLKALGCLLEAYFRQKAGADTRKSIGAAPVFCIHGTRWYNGYRERGAVRKGAGDGAVAAHRV